MMSPERFLESQRVCRCSDTLMFVFDRAVPDEHRDAVTLTTWAAEAHAAQGECAIEASPLGWLDSCVQTLAKLGWVTRERALAPRDAAASEALDDAAARMLTTQLGNDEAARCLLARLQSLGDWPAWPRWVGTVTRDDDAMPVLRTVLLLPVPPDGDAPDSEPDMGGTGADDVRPQRFQVSAWVATLNWPMFEVVRPVLLRRLGELTRAQALNNARHEARERVRFVAQLPLSAPTQVHVERSSRPGLGKQVGGPRAGESGQGQAAYVAKASLVAFAASVDRAARAHVLNSELFAQLGADARFDRERDFDNWHRFYLLVLKNIGWTVQMLDGASAPGGPHTIGQLSLALLRPHASAAELSVAASAFAAACRGLPAVFDESSHSSEVACFHIGTCTQTAQRVDATLIAFHFAARLGSEPLLSQVFDFRTRPFCAGVYRCTLELDAYLAVAKGISERLAERAEAFIHALEF